MGVQLKAPVVVGVDGTQQGLHAVQFAVAELLADPARAAALGAAAHDRVRDYFLGDRHLVQWVQLFDGVLRAT